MINLKQTTTMTTTTRNNNNNGKTIAMQMNKESFKTSSTWNEMKEIKCTWKEINNKDLQAHTQSRVYSITS